MSALARWYPVHGRHDLPWRHTRDRWAVLVSEVMLQQTQVARVLETWPRFMGAFPTATGAAAAGPGALIRAWGGLGYPRRARWLWEIADHVSRQGWPDDLSGLPGVGDYTAAAVAALVDGLEVVAVDANVRRVAERTAGRRLHPLEAGAQARRMSGGLRGRERQLALMDLGALVCRPRAPRCPECPLRRRCATRGVLAAGRGRRPAPYEGSFRQRRGRALAALRTGPRRAASLDREALASLVADGLAVRDGPHARLPSASELGHFDRA